MQGLNGGRLPKQSPLTAYSRLSRRWGFIGVLGTLVPILITPYYCVIGGWVLKYLVAYAQMAFTGAEPMGEAAVRSHEFFQAFTSAPFAPFGYGMLFTLACAGVIVLGVKNGIEKSNLVMMPILFVMALALSLYVVFLPGTGDGLVYYFVPNMDCLRDAHGHFSVALLGKTILGAMGQMFYSLSLAMGIMITYGSYMRREDSIERSVRRIEIFDTLVAVVAGLMIVPVVYMFAVKTGVTPELVARHGGDVAAATKAAVKSAMNAGPGLMFETLPMVFASLGAAGAWVGLMFFLLVTFAAATSAISLFEACVASVCDLLRMERRAATFFTGALIMFIATFSALGYGPWRDVRPMGMQFLDFFDFITNSVLMPIVAASTCVCVGWVLGPQMVIAEVQASGSPFRARVLYFVMVKWFAPALVIAILVSEICRNLGVGGWSI